MLRGPGKNPHHPLQLSAFSHRKPLLQTLLSLRLGVNKKPSFPDKRWGSLGSVSFTFLLYSQEQAGRQL